MALNLSAKLNKKTTAKVEEGAATKPPLSIKPKLGLAAKRVPPVPSAVEKSTPSPTSPVAANSTPNLGAIAKNTASNTTTKEALSSEQMTKIKQQLTMVDDALQATPMGDVRGHMNVLQKELQSSTYLVDLLLPEDIGLLVLAERKLMETDILQATTPKKRASTKKVPAKVAVTDKVKDMTANMDFNF